MDNSSGLTKNDSNDSVKINSNVDEVELTSNFILLKKRSGFATMMARIFPSEIDKVKNQYFIDSIKKKANKNIELYGVQTQYEVQVLTEVMNIRLVALKAEARDAITKKMTDKLTDIELFIEEKLAGFDARIDQEESRINNLKTDFLRKRALKSFEKRINIVYDGLDLLLLKFKNLLEEEIKINS